MFTARYVLHSTFCPRSVFMCFVWIWEQTAIISLYSIDWLVFVTETECVYCAVGSTFCPHSVFMCFVSIWEQTAIISLYSIDCLVFKLRRSVFTARYVLHSTFYTHSVLCVLCGSENKQRLFHCTANIWCTTPLYIHFFFKCLMKAQYMISSWPSVSIKPTLMKHNNLLCVWS